MSKLSRDLAIPTNGLQTLHPREIVKADAALAALNAELILPGDGAASILLDVRGAYVGTLTLEGSIDGNNWITIPVRPLNVASISFAATLASAAVGSFIGRSFGWPLIRVRMPAFTSGAALVTVAQNTGALDDTQVGLTTPSIITSVGASGAGVTLTIPSPGAGLRNYLTYLSINRFAAAALTAAATPVTVTTTNLPGSLAFSFGAEALPQGSLDRWREDFAYPLAASAQATACTVVCPATTGVIWRATAGYYVAP